MRLTIGALAATLAWTSAARAQSDENLQAIKNNSFVKTAEPGVRRRLIEGLRLLRENKPEPALERLLGTLSSGESPLLPWGQRETRQLHELLEDHLAAASTEVRDAFVAGLEKDAEDALVSAGDEPRWLLGLIRAYPGTRAAKRARRRVVDLALERGDILLATRHLARLAEPERGKRRAVVQSLLEASRRGSPWPTPHGDWSGGPRSGTAAPPKGPAPTALAPWPKPAAFRTSLAAGVVGVDSNGSEVAVFQDPGTLSWVRDRSGALDVGRVDMSRLTGRSAGIVFRKVAPCMLGTDLFVVHGGAAPTLLNRGDETALDGGQELFALRYTGEGDGFRVLWRWDPAKRAKDGDPEATFSASTTIHPFVLAIGDRVFLQLSHPEDRLNRRVYVACFRRDGRLEWTRFVARGAPLTAGLLMHRQETVRQGALRPAPLIFADGRLVCDTGVGILATIDPLSGELLWTFRSARIKALKSNERPWDGPRLTALDGTVYSTPADSSWFYRLRLHPGMNDILQAVPQQRRSLTQLLGVVKSRGAAYWMRRGHSESGPLRTLITADKERLARYDAPPLQPGEQLACTPLLTTESLVIATTQSLYWLDLGKDLFYERAFDLAKLGQSGWGPVVPFAGGVLFGGAAAPLFWR